MGGGGGDGSSHADASAGAMLRRRSVFRLLVRVGASVGALKRTLGVLRGVSLASGFASAAYLVDDHPRPLLAAPLAALLQSW